LCRKGEIQKFKGARFSLGIKKNNTEKTFLQEKIQLEKGDMLYICSDGYADQMNEKKKKFLLSEFTKLLNEISVLPLEEQKNILFEKNRQWRGNMTQTDDISVIGIKID
jgi:serine phosphatase RsbU (regulator of sigma subunit)